LLLVTNDAVCARLLDIANDELVENDEVVAKLADIARLLVDANDELVENDADAAKLEVVLNDELVLKELDNAKLDDNAFNADTANEDVVAKLLVTANDELSTLLEPKGPNTLLAVTKEAV
jgi:hypothetical protein